MNHEHIIAWDANCLFAINAHCLKKMRTLREGQPVNALHTARLVTGTLTWVERRRVYHCPKSRLSATAGPMKKPGKNIPPRYYKHIYSILFVFDTMYVINARTRSNRQMHGGIQCIWYYGCLLIKEVVLIVTISSFDVKQIQKGRNNYVRIFIVHLYRMFQVFRRRGKKNRPKRERRRQRSVGPGVYGNKILLTIWVT